MKIAGVNLILVVLLLVAVCSLGFIGYKKYGNFHFIFLNKDYSNEIQSIGYLASAERVVDFLAKQEIDERDIENPKDLIGKKLYMVIRLKNVGNHGAWGRLQCIAYKDSSKSEAIAYTLLYVPSLMPNTEKWASYAISLGGQDVMYGGTSVPFVEIVWEELYVK